jgi:hypothetical protein
VWERVVVRGLVSVGGLSCDLLRATSRPKLTHHHVTPCALLSLFRYSLDTIGKISVGGKPELYVYNAFFMTMRSKFVGPENSIHCYVVEWNPSTLTWSAFRNELLG